MNGLQMEKVVLRVIEVSIQLISLASREEVNSIVFYASSLFPFN